MSTRSSGRARSRWPPSRRWRSQSTPATVPRARRCSASSGMPPRSPGRSACRPTRWNACARRPSCTTSASSRCRTTSSPSPARSPKMSGSRCRRTRAWAPPSSNRCRSRCPVAELVRSHHERWDGNGYPAGLRGAAIPLGARILAVVDYFAAITSDRPFNRAMPVDEAVNVLWQEAGNALDPAVVSRYVHLLPALQEADEEAGLASEREAGGMRREEGSGAAGGARLAVDAGGAPRRHRRGQPGARRPVCGGRGDGFQPRRLRHHGGDILEAGPPGSVHHGGAVSARFDQQRLALPVRNRPGAQGVCRSACPRRRGARRRRHRRARVHHERGPRP